MKQVVVINGGTTFKNKKEYLSYLKTRELSLERMRTFKSWKGTLQEKLGKNYDVLFPFMPNTSYAKYEEWKITFDKIMPLLKDKAILIGHSLGGIFLAKYLAENWCPIKARAVILIAAPFDEEGSEESLGDFKLPKNLEGIAISSEDVYLIYSEDDTIVPIKQKEKYQDSLPHTEAFTYYNKQHFNMEKFPELIKLIKKLK